MIGGYFSQTIKFTSQSKQIIIGNSLIQKMAFMSEALSLLTEFGLTIKLKLNFFKHF